MKKKIMNKTYIKIGDLEFEIFLRDTFTAKEIYKNMPISGIPCKWGKEYYFYTQLKIPKENTAKQVIEFGEIAYWPNGDAIAIGYGKTPISTANEIKLADKCNVWADTKFDLNILDSLVNPKTIYVISR